MDTLLDAAFRWDGSSSDLAQQFYRAHVRLSASPSSALPEAMPFTHEELPDPIQSRLALQGLRFEQLPPLLQRALVWDSGYVYGYGTQLLRVYTSENRSMDQLAVSLESFRRAGCSARNCTSQYRSQFCNGQQMLSVVHCASEDIDSQRIHAAMWATGTGRNAGDTRDDALVVPEMNLLRHEWVDANKSYLVYAIHTVNAERQPSWSLCPQPGTNEATGLTVPCGVYRSQGNKSKWQPPPVGALVSQWLTVTKKELQERDGLSTGSVVGIVIGAVAAVLVVAIGAWCYYMRQKRSDDGFNASRGVALSPAILKPGQELATDDGDTYHISTTPVGLRRQSQQQRVDANNLHGGSITTNSALQALVSDPNLAKKRISFDEVYFQQQISRGAFGEVWLTVYQGRQVAVKRVRQDKRPTYQDLQDFTAEIQLTASLQHPHLVEFIGVAWRSIDTLCMLIEYMANGDLQAYLDAHMDTLQGFWTAEKTAIALGVAQALVYLHSHSPPLIHRDVKAKNVLLDEKLDARLVDFGVSRRLRVDLTMTAGVGTPFWTAPEIMEGVRYSESSDMYSFGVLLTELETCQLPYHDYQSRDDLQYDQITAQGLGKGRHAAALGLLGTASIESTPTTSTDTGDTPVPASLRPFLILNRVIDGSLRPSVSKSCPDWLRELATSCFRADPTRRPTAQQVVEILRRQWSILE